MLRQDNDRLCITVPMVIRQAATLLPAGLAALQAKNLRIVDLAEVSEVDSSALAVLCAWLRQARQSGRPLVISNPPPGLQALADLYDLSDILPLV